MITVDTPSVTDNNQSPLRRLLKDSDRLQLLIATAFTAAGLILFWYPVIGIAHATAGTILGAISLRKRPSLQARYVVAAGTVAIVAAVVMTIIELNSTEIVNAYDASPWI